MKPSQSGAIRFLPLKPPTCTTAFSCWMKVNPRFQISLLPGRANSPKTARMVRFIVFIPKLGFKLDFQ